MIFRLNNLCTYAALVILFVHGEALAATGGAGNCSSNCTPNNTCYQQKVLSCAKGTTAIYNSQQCAVNETYYAGCCATNAGSPSCKYG